MKPTKTSRVLTRPDPDLWANDELMTLAEAALLFWPEGPITEATLRTAVRDGRLAISEIAGKFFVNKDAIRRLSVCEVRTPKALPPTAPSAVNSRAAIKAAALEKLQQMKA